MACIIQNTPLVDLIDETFWFGKDDSDLGGADVGVE